MMKNRKNVKRDDLFYNGFWYYKYPESKSYTTKYYYYRQDNNKKVIFLHKVIYQEYFGEIPKGYHIHHIDGNCVNNHITNLEALSPSEHSKIHSQKQKENLKKFRCLFCGKEYEAFFNGTNKFCSISCKDKYRRRSGVDNTEDICIICGSTFTHNKKNKIATCSQKCHTILTNKKREVKCICKHCGKEYIGHTTNVENKWCSKSCGNAYKFRDSENQENRICVICGKEYSVYKKSKGKTCSSVCSGKLKSLNYKKKLMKNKKDIDFFSFTE